MPETSEKSPNRSNKLDRFVYTETDLVEIFVDSTLGSDKKSTNLQKKLQKTKKSNG